MSRLTIERTRLEPTLSAGPTAPAPRPISYDWDRLAKSLPAMAGDESPSALRASRPTTRRLIALSIFMAVGPLALRRASAQPRPAPGPIGEPTEEEKRWERIKNDIISGVDRADELRRKKKQDAGLGARYIQLLDDAVADAWWWVGRFLDLLSPAEKKKMLQELEKHYRDRAQWCRQQAGQTKNPLERAALLDQANQATADADRFAGLQK